jgi:tetratricopeptide (TPR) repeat protein
VPATVEAVLAARIDRLGPKAKRLLQAAAVIGKDVALPLLLAVADAPEPEVRAALAHLQAAELLYETRLVPDLEYTFKHALTHEVAYGGLLDDRRRALHVCITEALERIAPERAEHVERLAHHALRGELWEKAVVYLRQAGLRALARGANRDAIAHLEQALGALRRLPATRQTTELTIDIHLDIRNALEALDWGRMGEPLREAEVLARALGDQHRLARIATFMVDECLATGDYNEGVRFGREALSIARTLDDRATEVVATSFLGMMHTCRGEFSDAATLLERNVVALEGDLRHERFGTAFIQLGFSENTLAEVLSQLGRFDEAIGHAEAAVRVGEEADHPLSLFAGLHSLGLAHLRRGDLPRATPVLERCLDLSRTWQFVNRTPIVAAELGAAYILAGRAEALPMVAGAAEEFSRRHRQVHHVRPAVAFLCAGMAYLSAGRIDEAQSQARDALALSRQLGARGAEAQALCLAGDVAAAAGAEDAGGHYHEALALAGRLGMRPTVAHCHLGLGSLASRTGDLGDGRTHLTTATAMYREMGMDFWLEKAEAALEGIG